MASIPSLFRGALSRLQSALAAPPPTPSPPPTPPSVQSASRVHALLRPIRVYVSFHLADKPLKDQLETQLGQLKAAGKIETWSTEDVRPGEDWVQRITTELLRIDVALILISPDSLNSDTYLEMEAPILGDRTRAGVRILPVLLRPCMWDAHPLLRGLKVLPHRDGPIGGLAAAERDEAFLGVAREVERCVNDAHQPTAELRAFFEIYGSRQYFVAAKVSEAKNVLGAIARGIKQYMTREGENIRRAERFPSAPLTPAKVPSGTKFVPDGETWSHSTWKAIYFTMTQAFYFSYEIITSPDGLNATVRAHGDLAGNGKVVIYERYLELSADGTVSISPEVVTREIA